jgi:hypothetical protein
MSHVQKHGRPPTPIELLRHIDLAAQGAGKAARAAVQPIIATEVPKGRTSKLAAGTKASLRQTKFGQTLTIAVPRNVSHGDGATLAQVSRWVQRGTGELRDGPGPKKPIKARRRSRMILPGGMRRWEVKGQAPNPYMARIYVATTPLVLAAFREGAKKAAKP